MENNLPISINLSESFFEEEVRSGYTVTREMKRIWAIELDLLFEFNRVCEHNKIKYFACGGTLLGAVRHKGYIPWDDDIDVVMFREDYKRLCDCFEQFREPYFFQTEYTDRGTMRGHAQLRNSKTTGILKTELESKLSFNQGIFIDIFPLDNLPEEKKTQFFYKALNLRRKLLSTYSRYALKSEVREVNGIKGYVFKMISPVFKFMESKFCISKILYQSYESKMQQYNERESIYCSIMCLPMNKKFFWKKEWFMGEIRVMNFENFSIPVPEGYMELLTKQFGEWKHYVIGSTLHGDVIFKTDISYTEYFESM